MIRNQPVIMGRVMAEDAHESAPNPTQPPRCYCRKCGYALVGLESRNCPECGRAFDPSDARSYSRRPPRGAVWWWGRRVVVVLLVVGLPVGIGWGWLWWGWRSEQGTLVQLAGVHADVSLYPMGPRGLGKVMGQRLGYLLDRADVVSVANLPDVELDKLDFKSLGRLKSLSVYSCGVTEKNLASIGDARTLGALSISGGALGTSDLGFLDGLSQLRLLQLSNWSIGQAGMQRIGRLGHLKNLGLANCGMSDKDLESLQGLNELEQLDLSENAITDAGVQRVKNLQSLRTIRLLGTKVSLVGINELEKGMPRLKVIGDWRSRWE